jgi:hypothetical protein
MCWRYNKTDWVTPISLKGQLMTCAEYKYYHQYIKNVKELKNGIELLKTEILKCGQFLST